MNEIPNKTIYDLMPSSRDQSQGGRGGFNGNHNKTEKRDELNNKNNIRSSNYNKNKTNNEINNNNSKNKKTIQTQSELEVNEAPHSFKSLGDLLKNNSVSSNIITNKTSNSDLKINESANPKIKKVYKSKKANIDYNNLPNLNSSTLSKAVNESRDVIGDISMVSEDNRTFTNENDKSILSLENFEINKTMELENANFYYENMNRNFNEDRNIFITENCPKVSSYIENEKVIDISMNITHDDINLNTNNNFDFEAERKTKYPNIADIKEEVVEEIKLSNENEIEDNIIKEEVITVVASSGNLNLIQGIEKELENNNEEEVIKDVASVENLNLIQGIKIYSFAI